mgnify:CR=1 FL=1
MEDHAEAKHDWNPKAEPAESELTVGAMWQDHLATWESLRKLNDVTVMNKLSHSKSRFLRYTAHDLSLLDEDGWVDLEEALSHLQGCRELNSLHLQGLLCEACIFKAVRLSDRDSDREPRFELYISGSKTWIRATGGEIYRARSRS